MKFSTKSAYGLQVMLMLALEYEKNTNNYLSLKELVNSEINSISYLEKIIRNLKKTKLVKTLQGREGGYALNKKPENITIREILEILEGDLHPYKCLEKQCNNKNCLSKKVWSNLYNVIYSSLENITLKDLINNK